MRLSNTGRTLGAAHKQTMAAVSNDNVKGGVESVQSKEGENDSSTMMGQLTFLW